TDLQPEARARILRDAHANASKAVDMVEELRAYPGLHYRALLTRAKIARMLANASRDTAEAPSDEAKARRAQSVADLKRAVQVVEAPRSNSLGADKDRAFFFSQFVEAYELLITWLVEQGDYDAAVAYAQISRNRTFIEQVTVSEADQRAELANQGKS